MDGNSVFHSSLNKEVEAYGQVKSFVEGTVIINEDSYIQFIPIVLKGLLRVTRTEADGHEILLYYIKPGESCIMSFLGGIHRETSKVNAVAEEAAELLLVPVSKASAWIKEFPEWTDYIFKLYHKRFEELLAVVNSVAFESLHERLQQLLAEKVKLHGSREIKVTHQQLADELGSSREAVSRIVKQMENDGKLKLGRNKIIVL